MFVYGTSSKKKIDSVDEKLQEVCHQALLIMNRRKGEKYDFGITHGKREAWEQQKLYKQGRSEAGPIVTHCDGIKKKSRHQSGKAVDVAITMSGVYAYDEKALLVVACCFLEAGNRLGIPVRWGGNFESINDMPHFELI